MIESVLPGNTVSSESLDEFLGAHDELFVFIGFMLLDAVVAQVTNGVIELLDVVFLTADTEVSVLVDVDLQGVDGGQEDPLADVEFTIVAFVSEVF